MDAQGRETGFRLRPMLSMAALIAIGTVLGWFLHSTQFRGESSESRTVGSETFRTLNSQLFTTYEGHGSTKEKSTKEIIGVLENLHFNVAVNSLQTMQSSVTATVEVGTKNTTQFFLTINLASDGTVKQLSHAVSAMHSSTEKFYTSYQDLNADGRYDVISDYDDATGCVTKRWLVNDGRFSEVVAMDGEGELATYSVLTEEGQKLLKFEHGHWTPGVEQ